METTSPTPTRPGKNFLIGIGTAVVGLFVGAYALALAFEDVDSGESSVPGWVHGVAGVVALVCLVAFLFGSVLALVAAVQLLRSALSRRRSGRSDRGGAPGS